MPARPQSPPPAPGIAARAAARLARGALALVVAAALVVPAIVAPGPVTGADPDPAVIRPAESPVVVYHGSRDRRVVALTFDDGYAPWNGWRILRILQEERASATFFVSGLYVHRDPALWRAIAAAGYPIGNHTYWHRDIRRLSHERLLAEIIATRREVERVTGQAMAPIFRPPYGARNAASDATAAEAGFPTIVMWDVSALDATLTPRPAASIRAATRGQNGSIVLFHVGPSMTPRILREVIRSYRDRGFAFVTIPELLGLPAAVAIPLPEDHPGPAPPPCPATLPHPECDEPPAVAPFTPAGDDTGTGEEKSLPAAGSPRRTPVPVLPAARAAAWARSEGAEAGVAALTVVALLALVGIGAVLGRRGRREAPEA